MDIVFTGVAMATRDEVKEVLEALRFAIMCERCVFVPRPQTEQDLNALGMNRISARDLLKKLEVDDYVRGPEPDDDNNGKPVWIFGWDRCAVEIYIKFNVFRKNRAAHTVAIWSFHAAKWPLKYPLREPVK